MTRALLLGCALGTVLVAGYAALRWLTDGPPDDEHDEGFGQPEPRGGMQWQAPLLVPEPHHECCPCNICEAERIVRRHRG